MEKKSMFWWPNRPDIFWVSVKDHLCIVDKPQPCAKTGRMCKLSETDGIENITTVCIRHVHSKVTHNCLTNCWVLVMPTQAGALYSNSQDLCRSFPSSFIRVSFNRWLSLTCMLHLTSSFISLWFLPELDSLYFSDKSVSVRSFCTFIWNILDRYFSWSFVSRTLLLDRSQNVFPWDTKEVYTTGYLGFMINDPNIIWQKRKKFH